MKIIEHGEVMGNPVGEGFRVCAACGVYVYVGGGGGCMHYRPAALAQKRREAAEAKAAAGPEPKPAKRKPTDPMSTMLDAHRDRLLNRLGINPE